MWLGLARSAIGCFVGGVSLIALLVFARSRGRPRPYLDDHGQPLPGSLSEKLHVVINGVRQGMFIKGRRADVPVLLYLHGGMPDYFLTECYPTSLDDYFVVVWWEQRGSGLSYDPNIRPDTVTAEQLVSDTLALTNYLRARFKRARIYLMGHSGGTFIGLQAAARAPELYHAYLGVAQMTHQLRSEQRAYAYMLQRFKELGDVAMVQRLEAAPVGDSIPLPDGYMSVRDIAMHRLGIGTTHDMRSLIRGLILPSLLNREYTVREKIKMWRSKISSGQPLWHQQLSTDLTTEVTRLELPVYFLHGVHDFTVSYSEAKTYCKQLDAPVKGFYSFEHSAHSPLFEEPERMREIIEQDVFHGTSVHADA